MHMIESHQVSINYALDLEELATLIREATVTIFRDRGFDIKAYDEKLAIKFDYTTDDMGDRIVDGCSISYDGEKL